MDEQAVRAAVNNLVGRAHGLYLGMGEPARMVPETAIDALLAALDSEPAEAAEPADLPEHPAA